MTENDYKVLIKFLTHRLILVHARIGEDGLDYAQGVEEVRKMAQQRRAGRAETDSVKLLDYLLQVVDDLSPDGGDKK